MKSDHIIRGVISIYGWQLPITLLALLQHHDYKIRPYLQTFWQTTDFMSLGKTVPYRPSRSARLMTLLFRLGALAQIVLGGWLIYQWAAYDKIGWWAFGAAIVLAYPIVWAHLLCLFVWVGWLLRPKQLGKVWLCWMLEAQVRKLRRKHSFKLVAVVGSVGKTSTKAAIAKTLEASKRVMWQEGNYNDRLTVPLIFFGHTLPGLYNVPVWIRIWLHNLRALHRAYPYDVVVVEFGIDGPGQMDAFAYLKPDVVVVTAIAPEHMEYFGTLDAVAKEELAVLSFSKKTLVNVDDTPLEYLRGRTYTSYGLTPKATYYASKRREKGLEGQELTFYLGKYHSFKVTIPMLGIQGAKIATAAAAVAHLLDESSEDIEEGLQRIEAFAGRMRLFKGIKKSTLIDDTYNASPISTTAALDVLYSTKAPQRIAILGTMNELGGYSREAHHEVGSYCDPKKLDLVVTIGQEAKAHLAPIAEQRGCKVHACMSPYEAGAFVKKKLISKGLVLAKGSQNGVFAEEALKELLANKNDITCFVRQSNDWLDKKQAQFPDSYKVY